MSRLKAPALILAAALYAAPAAATTEFTFPPPVYQDDMVLNLAAETWVKSETAKVSLVVDAAMQGADAAALRDDLVKAARAVAEKGDWRVVALDRQPDGAGLDRWRAVLEARLPDGQIANLNDRARKASRPGLQIVVAAVDFAPTLAEVEAALADLRLRIYRQAADEVARLKSVFPDRTFRVSAVDFTNDPAPPHMLPQPRMAMMAEAKGPGGGLAEGVQEPLRLSARVSLASLTQAPKP